VSASASLSGRTNLVSLPVVFSLQRSLALLRAEVFTASQAGRKSDTAALRSSDSSDTLRRDGAMNSIYAMIVANAGGWKAMNTEHRDSPWRRSDAAPNNEASISVLMHPALGLGLMYWLADGGGPGLDAP
jgi:hypothetical protein